MHRGIDLFFPPLVLCVRAVLWDCVRVCVCVRACVRARVCVDMYGVVERVRAYVSSAMGVLLAYGRGLWVCVRWLCDGVCTLIHPGALGSVRCLPAGHGATLTQLGGTSRCID